MIEGVLKVKIRMSERKFSIDVLMVAVSVATFWTVVLPLQTYLPNHDSFDYSIGSLVPWISLLFVSVVCLSALVVVFLSRHAWLRNAAVLFLLYITICGYLEVGILSVGLPQIDGTLEQFLKPSLRKYIDIAVFLSLGSATIFFRRTVFKHSGLISLSLIIMTVASLFDMGAPVKNSLPKTSFDFGLVKQRQDVMSSVLLSPKRNVVILVLDATPGDEAARIIEKDGDLAKQLAGFVVYGNNIGMHEKTIRGVPALVTGRYLEKDDKPGEYLSSFYGANSSLNAFLDSGYSMFISPALLDPFTNRRSQFSKFLDVSGSRNPFFLYTKELPFITLFDVIRYRVIPYRYKMSFIAEAMRKGERNHPIDSGGNSHGKDERRRCPEERIFKQIGSACVDGSVSKTFQWYHTGGVHFPICYGEDGDMLPHSEENIESLRRYLHCVLRQVGNLMDLYRKAGVFDNTMVIVTTDHGIASYIVEKVPRSALLMVKPFGDGSPCEISDIPTSHTKIANLLRHSATENLGRDEIGRILRSRDRKVRVKQKTESKWWYFGRMYETYDIFFDDAGSETNRVNLGVFDVL